MSDGGRETGGNQEGENLSGGSVSPYLYVREPLLFRCSNQGERRNEGKSRRKELVYD